MRNARFSPAWARAAALTALLVPVGALAWAASLLIRDVYAGIPAAVPVSSPSARCDGDPSGPRCEVSIVALNPGRFRIATSVSASTVTLQLADASSIAGTHFLLTRSAVPGTLEIRGAADAASLAVGDVVKRDVRHVFAIPADGIAWDRIVFSPTQSLQPIVIDELGFFADDHGLRSGGWFQSIFLRAQSLRVLAIAALCMCGCALVAGWFLPGRLLNQLSPWLTAMLCLAIATLEIGTIFSPYSGRDVRSFYASEWLPMGPDANLTGGLYEASRMVQGLGETVRPGVVQWHRMPGYGLFCGLGALIGRTTDVIEIAAIVVVLQMLLYAAAAGIFVFAAQRLFTPWVAWLLGILIVMLPKQLSYTQVDSIIVPIQLLVLSAIVQYLAAERDGRATFRQFVWVNAAFAFWFFMRNDVLPGWIIVVTVLAGAHWRRLALPVFLILAIAVPWALYKRPYRHEFDLMPTNTGEVLLLSLCEVPGTFPFECTDVGYLNWARSAGHFDPTTSGASIHAATEVVRHWVTYPVHFGLMVFSKAERSITTQSFPGFQTRFNRLYGIAGDTGLFVVLLTVAAAAIALNHRRRQTLLLGWAVLLNMPLFFITFTSSGRFYAAAGVSLVVATVPLLCERRFYSAMALHPWRVAVVVACIAAFVTGEPLVERLVTTHDRLHYWTPFLDRDRSTLKFANR